MRRATALLSMLLGMLAARGLATEGLDSWRAWVVFKQYVRLADEVPDPGVSVQLQGHWASGEARLYLVRQIVEPQGDWLQPVGGVVCELAYADAPSTAIEFEAWTFDSGTFERFVDLIEQHPGFADRMARRPTRSAVYWEEA